MREILIELNGASNSIQAELSRNLWVRPINHFKIEGRNKHVDILWSICKIMAEMHPGLQQNMKVFLCTEIKLYRNKDLTGAQVHTAPTEAAERPSSPLSILLCE